MACRDADHFRQAPRHTRPRQYRGRIAYRAARGFDMEVGYHNRSAVASSSYRFFGSLVDLAAWSGFLIAATAGGADTRHLINAEVLDARLDVIEGEPDVPPYLKDLLQFENVVITPHVAGRAPDTRAAATALLLENLNAHFAGKPLRSPVPLTS